MYFFRIILCTMIKNAMKASIYIVTLACRTFSFLCRCSQAGSDQRNLASRSIFPEFCRTSQTHATCSCVNPNDGVGVAAAAANNDEPEVPTPAAIVLAPCTEGPPPASEQSIRPLPRRQAADVDGGSAVAGTMDVFDVVARLLS